MKANRISRDLPDARSILVLVSDAGGSIIAKAHVPLAATGTGSMISRESGNNAFNNANFGNPATTFDHRNLGQITSAGDARVVQAAIRYGF
jgi:hypothetical protein